MLHFLGFLLRHSVFGLSFLSGYPRKMPFILKNSTHLQFEVMWVFKTIVLFLSDLCICVPLLFYCCHLSASSILNHHELILHELAFLDFGCVPKSTETLGWMRIIQTRLDHHAAFIGEPCNFPTLPCSFLVWLLLRYYWSFWVEL